MKEQYVGDINDYHKYALLRALAADGQNRIGVCWMLTPPDGSSDGRKLAYLSQPERYRHCEPELFDLLAHAAAEPDQRRLRSIEDSDAIPGAIYHNDILTDDAMKRRTYMAACQFAFRSVDLIFFDPDNGIETSSIRPGLKNSSKYIYLDEIKAFYDKGKSILIYQHFPRIERKQFVQACASRLRDIAPGAIVWAFQTSHVVFLLLWNLNSKTSIGHAVETASSCWNEDFISGYPITELPNLSDPTSSQIIDFAI